MVLWHTMFTNRENVQIRLEENRAVYQPYADISVALDDSIVDRMRTKPQGLSVRGVAVEAKKLEKKLENPVEVKAVVVEDVETQNKIIEDLFKLIIV